MEQAYTIIFWVGVLYAVVTFLLGGVLGLFHFDGHVDTHADINLGPHLHAHDISPTFSISPLKPITIVAFITVFGGIGVIGTDKGMNGLILFIIAVLSAFFVAFILYRFIVVPLYKAQNTSAVSRKSLIGTEAKVISPILEDGFGVISYVVNKSRYNAPAQHVSKRAVMLGEKVIIYEIKNNVFYVQPINEKEE